MGTELLIAFVHNANANADNNNHTQKGYSCANNQVKLAIHVIKKLINSSAPYGESEQIPCPELCSTAGHSTQ